MHTTLSSPHILLVSPPGDPGPLQISACAEKKRGRNPLCRERWPQAPAPAGQMTEKNQLRRCGKPGRLEEDSRKMMMTENSKEKDRITAHHHGAQTVTLPTRDPALRISATAAAGLGVDSE
jgi:hypothetical protein